MHLITVAVYVPGYSEMCRCMFGQPMNSYEMKFLSALAVTVTVEAATVLLLLSLKPFFREGKRISWKCGMVAGTVPSFATLPYLWFVLPAFIGTYHVRIVSGEIGIVISEMVMIHFLTGLKWWKSLTVSAVANALSIIAGLIIF